MARRRQSKQPKPQSSKTRKKPDYSMLVTPDMAGCACPKCGEAERIQRFCWGCQIHYCSACNNQFDVRTPEQVSDKLEMGR